MKPYVNYLILSILTIMSNGLHAQTNETSISGYVYNPDHEPAMYSTVMLMNRDTVLVKGAFSQEDGSFVFDRIAPGEYYIQVRNVEFKTYLSDMISVRQNDQYIMDYIVLSPASIDLGEVVVTADKALVEIHPDKMVYNVSASVNASGSSGLELLGKAPGVTVDMDNNINLQGKSGVLIYINGRPSRLSGSDLANMLEGMRSDNIESIEIITNPSSKYDAEGTAGIINIIMKKNMNMGFNGNLVSSYSQGIYGRGNLGTNINYNADKLAFNTSISITDSESQDNFKEISERRGFMLDMETNGLYHSRGYNFSGGLDYAINEKNSISLDGRVFITDRSGLSVNNTGILDAENELPVEYLIAQTIEKDPSESIIFVFKTCSNSPVM